MKLCRRSVRTCQACSFQVACRSLFFDTITVLIMLASTDNIYSRGKYICFQRIAEKTNSSCSYVTRNGSWMSIWAVQYSQSRYSSLYISSKILELSLFHDKFDSIYDILKKIGNKSIAMYIKLKEFSIFNLLNPHSGLWRSI